MRNITKQQDMKRFRLVVALLAGHLMALADAYLLGCYQDDKWDRALGTFVGRDMDYEACKTACTKLGTPIFGRQARGECWCGGNTYSKHGEAEGCHCNEHFIGELKFCAYEIPEYVGCYNADPSNPGLFYAEGAGVSLSECRNTCQRKGYHFTGLENGDQCWCSGTSTLDELFAIGGEADECHCDNPDINDPNKMCVYRNFETIYKGCYNDKYQDRVFPHYVGRLLTYEACYEACKAKGYHFMGRQSFIKCYCGGDRYDDTFYDKHGTGSMCRCDNLNLGKLKNCVYRIVHDEPIVLQAQLAQLANANQNEVCGTDKVELKFTNMFSFVYDDQGTGADVSFSAWRPEGSGIDGWYRLGDVGMSGYDQPKNALLVKAGGDVLAQPVDYNLVWKYMGSSGKQGSFWEPVAPEGYSCIGHLAQPDHSKPSTDLIRCMKSGYVTQAMDKAWIWDNTGSGTQMETSVYQAVPASSSIQASTFITSTSRAIFAEHFKFMAINMNCIEGAGAILTDPNDYGSIATQYAPTLYFHKRDKYFPSSVEYYQGITNIENHGGKEYMISKHFVECPVCFKKKPCGDCKVPKTLKPNPPSAAIRPPVYAVAVPKGSSVVDVVYFMFYPFSKGKNVCLYTKKDYSCTVCLQFGPPPDVCAAWGKSDAHVGDWEHVTIRFIDGSPYQIFLSAYGSGSAYFWGDKNIEMANGHPVIFVANGSHAMYHSSGDHEYGKAYETPLVDRRNMGVKWETHNNVKFTPRLNVGEYSGEWSWMNYAGHWGNPEDDAPNSCPYEGVCLKVGPTGPMFKLATDTTFAELA